MDRARVALCTFTLALIALSALASPARAAERRCGTKSLYDRTLTIWLVKGTLGCSEVQRIVQGRCRARKVWSCFSFHPPGPVLAWFPERERFARSWSTVIEARRYRCGQPPVTAASWQGASWRGFPTLRQVLADDLLRCRQLHGMSHRRVLRLLGRPDARGKRRLEYELGPERDSFFQIDSEFLSIGFDRAGIVKSAEIYQG